MKDLELVTVLLHVRSSTAAREAAQNFVCLWEFVEGAWEGDKEPRGQVHTSPVCSSSEDLTRLLSWALWRPNRADGGKCVLLLPTIGASRQNTELHIPIRESFHFLKQNQTSPASHEDLMLFACSHNHKINMSNFWIKHSGKCHHDKRFHYFLDIELNKRLIVYSWKCCCILRN